MQTSPCEIEEDVKRIIFNFALEAQEQVSKQYLYKKKRVIVISGGTACGKSALAMELAQLITGEIVSADSMQIYRGMDIGTAKPTLQDRLLVSHHLIDIRPVAEKFNVVDFCFEASRAIQEILDRGNVPIVVGGSGFYLHALLYGPPSGPPSVPELRELLEQELSQQGADSLYQRVKEMDPQYAKTITKHDKQKIIRALEIMSLTKKKVSDHNWKGQRAPKHFDFRCWYLTRPKASLYQRIEQRCDEMLTAGLIDEVQRLIDEGLLENSSASQAIGYRQVIDFLQTGQTESDYEAFVAKFKQATRNYAKRQETWFRKEREFKRVDLDLYASPQVIDMIMQDYEL